MNLKRWSYRTSKYSNVKQKKKNAVSCILGRSIRLRVVTEDCRVTASISWSTCCRLRMMWNQHIVLSQSHLDGLFSHIFTIPRGWSRLSLVNLSKTFPLMPPTGCRLWLWQKYLNLCGGTHLHFQRSFLGQSTSVYKQEPLKHEHVDICASCWPITVIIVLFGT